MKRRNVALKLAVIALGMILGISGCSNTTQGNAEITEEPTTLGTDWQEVGFRMEELSAADYAEGMENPILRETEYHVITGGKPDFEYTVKSEVTDSFKDRLYIFSSYELPEKNRYTLEKQWVLEEKSESREVILPEHILGGCALKLDVISEDVMGILFLEETEQENRYYCLKADGEGNVLSCVLLAEKVEPDTIVRVPDFYIDTQGYSYLLKDRGTLLHVFDSEGETCLEQRLLPDSSPFSCSAFHMSDGSLVCYVPDQDEQKVTMLWFEMPGGKQKELAELEFDNHAYAMAITEAGDLYLLQPSKLLKWNVVTGEQEVLFNCVQSNLNLYTIKSMEVTPEGKVLLYQSADEGNAVYVLNDEEVRKENGIILAGLEYPDNYVKAQTAAFSRKNPDTPIIYETGSGDEEAYHNQVMAQLAAGKGPDLLWLDVADMQILQEKGALMDLREIISEETLQQMFPGIVESGTVNGTLTGLYFDAYASSMLVNNDVWPENRITSMDMIELAKKNDRLQGLIGSDMTFSKIPILSIAALSNPEKSPFLDFEKGESHFDNPEFVELLTLVNQYGDNPECNMKDKIKGGEFLMCRVDLDVRNLPAYSKLMAEYGDTCHLMGFPDEDAYQGYWPGDTFLVVNAKTENKEVIGELFEYLLGWEAQQQVTKGSVRRDVIEKSVVIGVSDGVYKFKKGSNEYYTLETKEDGSTYLEEYLNFLDNCAPLPRSYEEIEEIVLSGAEDYFDGLYTAEQAAEMIDNRVQLYLDERK